MSTNDDLIRRLQRGPSGIAGLMVGDICAEAAEALAASAAREAALTERAADIAEELRCTIAELQGMDILHNIALEERDEARAERDAALSNPPTQQEPANPAKQRRPFRWRSTGLDPVDALYQQEPAPPASPPTVPAAERCDHCKFDVLAGEFRCVPSQCAQAEPRREPAPEDYVPSGHFEANGDHVMVPRREPAQQLADDAFSHWDSRCPGLGRSREPAQPPASQQEAEPAALASSDPEGHRQAIADHEAEAEAPPKPYAWTQIGDQPPRPHYRAAAPAPQAADAEVTDGTWHFEVYELHGEDEMLVASGSGPDKTAAIVEGSRYAYQYAQDGPIKALLVQRFEQPLTPGLSRTASSADGAGEK